jgi:hypothetical protein
LILLGLAEIDHADIVVDLALDPADCGQLIFERPTLLHQALRALAVVPEARVFGESVQLIQPPARFVEVKDASSAAQRTA